MDSSTATPVPGSARPADIDSPPTSIGVVHDGARTRRWGRHATWITLDHSGADATELVVGEIDRTGSGATVVVDLVGVDAVDNDFVSRLRVSAEQAVQRAAHVVVVASALEVRHALVSADIDHLTPMPQSRRDAMAFLRSVLQPISA